MFKYYFKYKLQVITLIKLNNTTLKKKLNQINTNPQMKEKYFSKWHTIENFLHSNVGLTIAAISPQGSLPKGTATRKSDLDVIFCTSPNKNKKTTLNLILQKAKSAFGKVAKNKLSKKAVHIDFAKPKCNIDVVYLTKAEFKKTSKDMKSIKKISQLQKKSIILSKY
ncbi:hypothetical protein LCGC14_3027290 [marine sediment metagenome]|uniref:Polymerase nucleotidyl transferase domain-containing protein n=1 Tax=marine sediment metagenome TaxID=412755 RepID=A0A0F8XGL9_9ZZZZ